MARNTIGVNEMKLKKTDDRKRVPDKDNECGLREARKTGNDEYNEKTTDEFAEGPHYCESNDNSTFCNLPDTNVN